MLKKFTFLILFALMGSFQTCYAAISLSVNPVDGSNTLRFDKTPMAGEENKKEIHIRVSSTNGDRYQVFQRILEPMVDESGNPLNLQAIETETLSNSNSTGTLYLQNSDHLSMSDQLVYSSSQSGQGDGFIIAYAVNQNLINSTGNFRGRLVFSVRGLGNGTDEQTTIDVLIQTASSLKITVRGAHHSNRVRIKATDTTQNNSDNISISFSGNTSRELRIYQEVETYPQNETDQSLGRDVLQLDTEGQSDGLRTSGLQPLGSGRTLIYSSDRVEDSFVIYFLVNTNEVNKQDAGVYKGNINYIVETDGGKQEFPVNIECDIPPVFSVNVTPPPGGVNFTHVLANSPAQDKEVVVSVQSNLHKPYQVLQDLQTNMTNTQGKEFDSKYFTLQVEIPYDQRGRTDFVEFSPVKTGEYPIFSSDGSGKGATFKVVYRLQGYPQMNPGDFSAPIRFSLDQK